MESEEQMKGLQGRSEEVEMVLGQTPNWIFRWGIIMIAIAVGALLVVCWFIPWPETLVVHGKLEVLGPDTCWLFRAEVPVDMRRELRTDMTAYITLDIEPEDSRGHFIGRLVQVPPCPNATGLYSIVILEEYHLTNLNKECSSLLDKKRREEPWLLDATSTIVCRKRRLLSRLLGRF